VPFSSVDWPGQLAAVVFIAGCPWRCSYCHNPHLQERYASYDWPAIKAWLRSRQGLLDGVVFSGGEPLSEPKLPQLARELREMGFGVGLHTAGIYPQRLGELLAMLDWVGLDIKSDREGYDALTGRPRSEWLAGVSLQILLDAGVDFECRTTWHPDWLSEARLLAMADELAWRGVKHYAVQLVRSSSSPAARLQLSETALRQLDARFCTFAYRAAG
jgi:pyruvate formate lyase activating enzyme